MPDQEAPGLAIDHLGALARVRLDRPDSRNALSNEVLMAIGDAMEEAQAAGARCVLLLGSERVFAAGADLKELRRLTALEHYFGPRHEAWDRIRRISIPIVAVVRGFCLGGGFELALSTDLIIASESAVFGFPETSLGLVPGGGGSQLLRRAVGRQLAMDLVLTGRRLSAQEAQEAGIVSRVASDDEAESVGLAIATALSVQAPAALRLAKETMNRAFDLGWEAGLQFERRAFALTLASGEAAEGIAAFLEKRPPDWTSV